MNRMFSMREMRNVSSDPDADLKIEPTFNKNWFFDRDYSVNGTYEALKLTYNASNKALIDEPYGEIDEDFEKTPSGPIL